MKNREDRDLPAFMADIIDNGYSPARMR